MLENITLRNAEGLKIAGLLDRINLEHAVLILHGSASNKLGSSASDIYEELALRGISTLRIDQNGCGESDGKYEDQTISGTISDTDAALAFLKQRGFKKISLYGASRGGTTAVATASRHPELFRLGVKSPVSDYMEAHSLVYGTEFMDRLKKEGQIVREKKGKQLITKYSFYEDAEKHRLYDLANAIKSPALVVHGSKDEIVPIEQSVALVKNMPYGSLYILPGANHDGEINKDRSACMKIFGDWFESGEVERRV